MKAPNPTGDPTIPEEEVLSGLRSEGIAAALKEPDDDVRSRSRSVISSRSAHSLQSHKRLLEAKTNREKEELKLEQQKRKLEVMIRLEKLETERARLREELDDQQCSQRSNVSSCSKSVRTRQWVENVPNLTQNLNDDFRTPELQDEGNNNSDIKQLTRAITDALKIASKSNTSNTADKLLGRLSARDLPSFSGDPMDWLRFKNTFHTTTRIGKYTEDENISRLQRCLHGEAWEAVSARLLATSSASDIMRILEMRFGRPDLILAKLIADMKRVPKLSGARNELVLLATKVDNCVAAIESTGHLGYLYSPELTNEIINKLTEPIFYRWLDYSRGLTTQQPQLPVLAKYLISEAEELCKRGAVEIPAKFNKPATSYKRPVLMTNPETSDETVLASSTMTDRQAAQCIFCDDTGHQINACEKFKKHDVNERWEWVCKRRLCFRCLKATHRRDRCKAKLRCTICKGSHHRLLHRDDLTKTKVEEQTKPEITTTANIWSTGNKKVYLKVLPVTLEGPEGSFDTYALLDEGSTITLIETSVAAEIGARGPSVDLTLQGAVGQGGSTTSQVVSLTIKTAEGSYQLDRVRTVDQLTLPKCSLDERIISKYDHLKTIPLQAFQGRPAILIGQDNWHLIVSREIREGKENEPVASLTKLGWVLHGFSSSISSKIIPEFIYHLKSEDDDKLHNLIENYFHIDSLGVRNSEQPRLSPEERRAIHILDTKSERIDDHWETALLWRDDDVKLPDNKRNAEHRLRIIERMMDSDVSFATDYTKQVENMLEKDYARKATTPPSGRIWYLPHFGVRNPNKPGKLRLVFDAKADTKGISLNTELLTGPDLLNSLLGVLLRFRERKVAVTADIREMFLQVKINEQDQNAQCFLWRGKERKTPPDIYKMTSMTFGATSSPCTATYIIRRNADDYTLTHPRAAEAIKKRHYVDDYLDSVDSEEEMKQLVSDVVMIHKVGGFDIRGWASNRPNVLPLQETSTTVSLVQQHPDDIQRTLGLNWKPGSDTLGFDLSLKRVDKDIIEGVRCPTKREMLKVIMSVFDPLGMLSPFTINGKILLQEVWRLSVNWDEQVNEKVFRLWTQWVHKLQNCKSFSIPRCYGFSELKNVDLHIFVDASEQAYAAVAYLTRLSEVVFIAGKSRVAPLKSVTIPKLELQAAVMGARLGHTILIEQGIDVEKRFYWTDSQTVWKWIKKKPRKQNVFVSNRLSEIDELTKTHEWRWLAGSLNVADEATRANPGFDFAKSKWIEGPDFLRLPEEAWPKLESQPNTEEESDDDHQERVLAVELVTPILDFQRFSSWRRLVRCVAYVLLFLEKCKLRTASLTPDHEHRAEIFVLKQIQAECFAEELAACKTGTPVKPHSRLRRLNAHMNDEGLLCVKSRLEFSTDLPKDLRTPIILDAKHRGVKLIIEHKHRQLKHLGTATLINELRQNYYILRLRNEVRSLLATCTICKIRRARCEQPMMAALPSTRLQHHCRPFSYCGIDLFGPMTVTIGRRHEKRWGVIFTCLNVRAVHIELAASLSTDSTIMALRRMAARRGWPKQIHSDNGTNFRSADKELQKAVKDILSNQQFQDKILDLGVKWTFNPPEAPHMGGVWERLVRSIKTTLAAILFTRSPKEETLMTLLLEAENTVNSRPLTTVSLDPDEEEALTPNHFLVGSSNGMPSLGVFSDDDLTHRKQWRIAQRLSDHFWMRWIREYLPTLQERKKWFSDNQHNEEVGDLILIADGAAPRNVWPRGRVISTLPGRDGRVRMVDVHTRGGTLRRPVTKLVLLAKCPKPNSAST